MQCIVIIIYSTRDKFVMKRNNFLRPAPVIITGKCKLKQGLFLNTFLCLNKYQSKI